jgi:hypothetical protein
VRDFARILDRAIVESADAGHKLETTNAAIARLQGWSDDAGGSRMCQIRQGNRPPFTAERLLRLPPDVLRRIGLALMAHAQHAEDERPISSRSPESHVLGITKELGELADHIDESLRNDGVVDANEARVGLPIVDRLKQQVDSLQRGLKDRSRRPLPPGKAAG